MSPAEAIELQDACVCVFVCVSQSDYTEADCILECPVTDLHRIITSGIAG